MSTESTAVAAPVVIELAQVSKRYLIYSQPRHRLLQMLSGGRRKYGQEFWALRDVNLTVRRGEVVGIVGRNGAGKSTLLQLVCGTLQPSDGLRRVQGTVAALLELGAGFNPDFTGRENVFMNAAILGLSRAEIESRFDAIAAFADIGDVLDRPVKTYSSGMFMRLAFAVAVHVDPEILVIDEALSVGDGVFARKSFDRIMAMKDAGKTILFCSHSTYHIESICSRALWIDQGQVRLDADPARVVAAYNDFLGREAHGFEPEPSVGADHMPGEQSEPASEAAPAFRPGQGRLVKVEAVSGAQRGKRIKLHSLRGDLRLEVSYVVDPALPLPSVIMSLFSRSGNMVCSSGSHNDHVQLPRDEQGCGMATLSFPRMALLKGDYFINVFLACERGLHYYESALYTIDLEVTQDGLEQGVVTLPHHWNE